MHRLIACTRAGALVALAALAACHDGATPPPALDAAALDATTGEADAAATCGAAALCDRTIDDCHVAISRASCLGFYDPATTTCGDLAGYTACNCACIEQPSCDGYFACGTTCFEDWC